MAPPILLISLHHYQLDATADVLEHGKFGLWKYASGGALGRGSEDSEVSLNLMS